MLIKSAGDKSKRLALLQDLQQSPLLDICMSRYGNSKNQIVDPLGDEIFKIFKF